MDVAESHARDMLVPERWVVKVRGHPAATVTPRPPIHAVTLQQMEG